VPSQPMEGTEQQARRTDTGYNAGRVSTIYHALTMNEHEHTIDQLRAAWHAADREERQAIKITVDALKRDTPGERETVARRIQAHLKP
jgi:hypothetical protein